MNKLIDNFFSDLQIENRICFDKDHLPGNDFEEIYLEVRKHEGRNYSDEEVNNLPVLDGHQHTHEWKIRARSAGRVFNYFSVIEEAYVLDIGCGNGWFANYLSGNQLLRVVGMDVNRHELEQAARVFAKPNIRFLWGDLFQLKIPKRSFNFVTVNAAIQYFQDFTMVIERFFELLTDDGEIHIIDSPFYKTDAVESAKGRTSNYYHELGFDKMAANYFHHTYPALEKYNYDILYDPGKGKFFKKLFRVVDSPMPWIRIKKK